jgi:hypothetical protein
VPRPTPRNAGLSLIYSGRSNTRGASTKVGLSTNSAAHESSGGSALGQPETNRHRRTLSRSTSNSGNVCGQAGTAGECQLPTSGEPPLTTTAEPSQSWSLGDGSAPYVPFVFGLRIRGRAVRLTTAYNLQAVWQAALSHVGRSPHISDFTSLLHRRHMPFTALCHSRPSPAIGETISGSPVIRIGYPICEGGSSLPARA